MDGYDNCISGKYPLSRYLLIYVNKKPGEPLDTLTREFIKFIAVSYTHLDVYKRQPSTFLP